MQSFNYVLLQSDWLVEAVHFLILSCLYKRKCKQEVSLVDGIFVCLLSWLPDTSFWFVSFAAGKRALLKQPVPMLTMYSTCILLCILIRVISQWSHSSKAEVYMYMWYIAHCACISLWCLIHSLWFVNTAYDWHNTVLLWEGAVFGWKYNYCIVVKPDRALGYNNQAAKHDSQPVFAVLAAYLQKATTES